MAQKKERVTYLEGRSCYLRPVLKSDAGSRYLSWINNEETLRYLDYGRFPTTLEQLREYIADKKGSSSTLFLAIVSKASGKHIGNVKLEPINWVNRSAGFSIFIGNEKYRSKGIGKEVVRLMIDCAFYRLNLRRISLGVINGNVRALNLYKKMGFKVEGVEREAIYNPKDKIYVNNIKMGLLKKEYERSISE